MTASVYFSSDVANPDTYTKFYCDIQMYTTTMTQPDLDQKACVVVFDDARHGPEFEATDINYELARDGFTYPCNHPSAMPPEPKYIAEKISLDGRYPEAVGEGLARLIIEALRRKANTWS